MKKIMLTLMALLLVPAIALGATVLEVGSNGSDVTKVQKRLIQYGYMTGSADGKYGEKTRASARRRRRRSA